MSSPHPWGCFLSVSSAQTTGKVFPTPVGVFPHTFMVRAVDESLPHTRGGVSHQADDAGQHAVSSPHPWGCFQSMHLARMARRVFPTPVGVFPARNIPHKGGRRLPHTRGGVSSCTAGLLNEMPSSPHPWGCFPLPTPARLHTEVFPTPVGVFLQQRGGPLRAPGLPHTRGGVSEVAQADSANGVSSCTACRFSSRCSLSGFLPQHNSRPA